MTTIPPNPDEALVTISTPAPDTVRIRDRVESSRFEFYFDDDVEITPAPTDSIYFPVDVAAQLNGGWSELTLPQSLRINVRERETGTLIASCSRDGPSISLDSGHYNLELSSAPVKLYLSVTAAVEIERQKEETNISKVSEGTVVLGARSFHDQPAGEITTTSEVEDVMSAISMLSSGLKTTTPEHSWPTLRGHPPAIQIGDRLEIPDHIQKPESDVFIEVPETLASVLEIAPLAYYTAATVRPLANSNAEPAIVAAGERFSLSPGPLNKGAFNVMRDVFLLDCIVRTEGYYPLSLFERTCIESSLPWTPTEVYDLPIAERIVKYMEVSEEVLSEIRPRWPLTVDVTPDEDSIPGIPYLAEELPLVRCGQSIHSDTTPSPDYLNEFVRSDGGAVGSGKPARGETEEGTKTFTPDAWDTQLHVSLRDGYPIGSNKTGLQALEKHVERSKPSEQSIEVHVICNEEEMREEEVVTEFYGVRDLLEFDVEIHHSVTKSEFRELLSEPIDLIHYIGHVDDAGILCSDGYLDASEVNEVNVDAFILNACRSVHQGEALLDAGASGGVVTLFDVPNSSATKVGRSLSRLLNRGFNLRAAVEIARDSSVLGRRWISIGDGRLALTQPETGVPSILNILEYDPEERVFTVELEGFGTITHGIGTLRTPNFGLQDNYIHPRNAQGELTPESLEDIFLMEVLPVRFQNELLWTDEIGPADLINAVER